MKDYYAILGCSPAASHDELKKRYQQLVLKNHPDKVNSNSVVKKDAFLLIDEAWKILRDPEQRRLYDILLKQEEFNNQLVVFAVLDLSQLSWQAESQTYQYKCRCGGIYSVAKHEPIEDHYVACNECSLVIHIKNESVSDLTNT